MHWGPFVCHYTLQPQEVKAFKLLEDGQDYRNNLAGHLENEKELDKEKVSKILTPYLNSYIQGYHEYRGQPLCNGFEVKPLGLIVKRKMNLILLTHMMIIYLLLYIQKFLKAYKRVSQSVSNSPGPGCITFDFNTPGDNT